MFTTQLRKVGDSWVIAVPSHEIEALGIPEGATVTVEIREEKVALEPVLAPDLREVADWALKKCRRGLEYLAWGRPYVASAHPGI